ncbi:thioredoxin family protein [Paenibacillus sp. BSR1-1]|uniref:thioredoxin family protein n=1 Tax=Paenibacillus sp. BSR1-1 TaxID=3020845 RepID=UPI0025AF0A80|nr:thioredoxin family protein [Paenibacillus sp. BSR1-1]MDN3018193.1 thioredoxin family protein [Paenibacillus sp. BSR1-1]
MKHLESIEEFEQLRDNGKTIFMFSAVWCGDCRFIEPALPEIEAEFTEYTFIHIDRDQFIDLCQQVDVFGIPSFIAYENGKELGRFVSKDRKTQEEIEGFIKGLKS